MGLRSRNQSQSSHGHLRECTACISSGMSVVPNLEIWSLIPTNITLAAKCSVSAVAHHAAAKPPYEPPVTPTLARSTNPA